MRRLLREWWAIPAAIALVLGIRFVPDLFAGGAEPEEVGLSRVVEHVADGEVVAAVVDEERRSLTVTLEDGRELATAYVGDYGGTLTEALLRAGVETDVASPPGVSFLDVLGPVVLVLLLGVLVVVMRTQHGLLARRTRQVEVPATRFTDIAGADEAVAEMQELVEFLRDGTRFAALGTLPPKGALLVGPPGTGKTLLARAVAGEAGVPFFEVAGSDFVEKYVGVGASRVRSLFKDANRAGKAIIFIDEIDAAGRARSSGEADRANTEQEGTLTALLTEIDGFTSTDVIVIGATNRRDVIDAALLRRLEREIQVPLPDRGGRTAILELHASGKPFTGDVDWVKVGRQAFGMSGADLEKVVNEAAMEAARRGEAVIAEAHVYAALSTVEIGRARTSAVVTERDREITAWHEAGHALVAVLAEHVEDPTYVTIIPRGGSGGHTRPGGNDHQFLSRPEALDALAMAMGGRAAELMLLGEDGYTQGAASDLQHATRVATSMVTEYGMASRLAHVHPDALRVGGEVAVRVDEEVERLLREALDRARRMLAENADAVRRVVAELLDRETLTGRELAEILGRPGGTQGRAFEPAHVELAS